MIQSRCRQAAALLQVLVFAVISTLTANAAEKTLIFSGVPVTVQDVTADVEVNYSSMRLNRALNVWNVEVSVRNKSAEAIRGPIALYIDGFTGTTGVLQPDGLDGANAFYDLNNWVANG